LRNLAVVHEQPMHVIIVSHDLWYFDHVHPEPADANGVFKLRYTFPRDGRYLLFADLTPKGNRSQVFRVPLEVRAGKASTDGYLEHEARLVPDTVAGKLVGTVPFPKTPQNSASWEEGKLEGETLQAELIRQPRT